MSGYVDTAINGIIQGVAYGLVWLLLGFLVTFTRDQYIRHRLRNKGFLVGMTRSCHGFGITIRNCSSFPVVIKDVTLYDKGNMGVELLFAWERREPAVSETPFKDERTFKIMHARLKEADTPAWRLASVSLDAFSVGTWLAPSVVFTSLPPVVPVRCLFSVQYQTLFGKPRELVIGPRTMKDIDIGEEFQKYIKERNDGKYIKSAQPEFLVTTTEASYNQNSPI
jgi:hypothetical protein